VSKAEASECSLLLSELATATAALNEGRFEVEDILCRMRAAGIVEPSSICSSSSSSSSECDQPTRTEKQEPEVVSSAEGLPAVLAALRGEIAVCGGKACCRKGDSDQIYEELVRHFEAREGVSLVRCSCLGQCKYAANVRLQLEEERRKPMVVKGVELQTVQGITCPSLSVMAT
jgi:hypothetical protein